MPGLLLSSKAKSRQTDEKSATPNQDMLIKSGQANASDQLEQKIIETERETETLTEELSRLDEMWNKNNTYLGIDNDAAGSPDKSQTPDSEKTASSKKHNFKNQHSPQGEIKNGTCGHG